MVEEHTHASVNPALPTAGKEHTHAPINPALPVKLYSWREAHTLQSIYTIYMIYCMQTQAQAHTLYSILHIHYIHVPMAGEKHMQTQTQEQAHTLQSIYTYTTGLPSTF